MIFQSYTPTFILEPKKDTTKSVVSFFKLLAGLEPATYALRMRCSTN